jgi:phenylacetate-CoA ligase
LGQFAEFLSENRISPKNYPKKCFVTGAEKLMPEHRKAIESVFGPGRPVHERYGGRDFGAVAIQTKPNHSLAFDVDWTWAVVEPENSDPESPILVTKLHADAMPMIRYRVGDIAEFPAGSKPGFPTFSLEEVIGRELDRIWLKAGGWISGAELPHLLKGFRIREYSFFQSEDYGIELKIIPKDDFDEVQKTEILRVLASNMNGIPVDFQIVDKIERAKANKWRPVVSMVKR